MGSACSTRDLPESLRWFDARARTAARWRASSRATSGAAFHVSRTTKHDYDPEARVHLVRHQRPRALPQKHGIKSVVDGQRPEEQAGWDALREEFKAKLSGREIETLVDARIARSPRSTASCCSRPGRGPRYIKDVNRENDPRPSRPAT
jgi:hypothetical protein